MNLFTFEIFKSNTSTIYVIMLIVRNIKIFMLQLNYNQAMLNYYSCSAPITVIYNTKILRKIITMNASLMNARQAKNC